MHKVASVVGFAIASLCLFGTGCGGGSASNTIDGGVGGGADTSGNKTDTKLGTDGGTVAGTDGGTVAGTDGGTVAGTNAGQIPYILEPSPSAANTEALVKKLRAEAEKAVSQEIKNLVAKHATDHGYQVEESLGRAYSSDEAYDLQFEPKDLADLLRMLGYEALFKGNISVSKWLFLWAAELKPGDPMLLNDAGFALIQSGQLADAKAIVLRALAIDRDLHSLYVNLSTIYRKDAKARQALLAILRAISLQPKVVTYRQAAAEIYLDMGNTDSAYRQYEVAIKLDPGNAEIQSQLDALPEPADSEPPVAVSVYTIITKVLECETNAMLEYGQKVMAPSGKENAVDQDFQNETSKASSDWSDCRAAGGGWDQCSIQECMAYQAALARATPREIPLPFEAESMYFQTYDYFMGCITPTLVKETDTRALAAGLDEVDRYYSQITYAVRNWHTEAAELIQLWQSDVAGTCDNAEQSITELNLDEAFRTVNRKVALDLCLDKALCIGINNSNIAVSASVGIFSGKLSTDLATGDWAVSAGVGVSDPTGTLQAGLSLKFHSTKGVGVSTDVKIGGPVKVRAGGDFYASEALK